MTDLAFASALEQARMVREKEISPVDLVELYARRIEELNPRLNAYVTLCLDRALDEAREAEALVGGEDLPPFHGVPISIKDLNDTAGVRTTHGSAAFADRIPDEDDEVVERIRAAGFIMLGKTNTPEFGSVPFTEPEVFGPTRNPWDIERTPGGSSGGAAAALAAGLCPISQGSDGGGSIRIPSSCCGLFGIKPTRGRVSSWRRPTNLLSQSGPIARAVEDAAALLDVISGHVLGDTYWAPPPERAFVDEAGRPPGRLRVAWTTATPIQIDVAPGNRKAIEETASLLAELGHDVTEEAPPWSEEIMYAFFDVWCVGAAMHDPMPSFEDLEPINQALVTRGRGMTATDLGNALRRLHAGALPLLQFFERYDALLTPVVAIPPPRIGEFKNPDEPLAEFIRSGTFTPYTAVWNSTGSTAASVPLLWDEHGLPVGVQIVARPGEEATLIRLASQLEEARPWADRRPPVS